MKRTLLDTNIYIDWLNAGLHEHLVLGSGRLRILSALSVGGGAAVAAVKD